MHLDLNLRYLIYIENVASTSFSLIYYVPCIENINMKRHHESRHGSQVASICYKSKNCNFFVIMYALHIVEEGN